MRPHISDTGKRPERRARLASTLALAFALGVPCLVLSACRDKHEPLKPTVVLGQLPGPATGAR